MTLDHDAVQLYWHWIYNASIHVDESISRESDGFALLILKAWDVADSFEDLDFPRAIVAYYMSENKQKARFDLDSIQYAWKGYEYIGEGDEDCDYDVADEENIYRDLTDLQRFVVDNVLEVITPRFLVREDIGDFPKAFIWVISRALMRSFVRRPTKEDILRRYTQGRYRFEAEALGATL